MHMLYDCRERMGYHALLKYLIAPRTVRSCVNMNSAMLLVVR